MLTLHLEHDPAYFHEKPHQHFSVVGFEGDTVTVRYPDGRTLTLDILERVPGLVNTYRVIYHLWPHQVWLKHQLKNKSIVLIDAAMRSGKSGATVQLMNTCPELRRILVVCPLPVVPVWKAEVLNNYAGHYTLADLDDGSVKEKMHRARTCLDVGKSEGIPAVVVINYGSVWREPFGSWARMQTWDLLIYDESHALCSPGSKQSRFAQLLSKRAARVYGLSGTPFPRAAESVYAQYRALDDRIFGTRHTAFQERYFIIDRRAGYPKILGLVNTEDLKAKVALLRIHVKPRDLRLPPVVTTVVPVKLPRSAWDIYEELEDQYYVELEKGEVTAANAGVKAMRLRQVTSGFLPVETDVPGKLTPEKIHDVKADALATLLDGLPQDEPVVVYCHFRYDLARVHDAARHLGRTSSELSGSRKDYEDWLDGKTSVLAAQIGAAAEGINLSRSNYVIYYSIDYSLKNFEQSRERVRVHDKKDAIGVYYLIATGTIEERVYAALRDRREAVEALLGPRHIGEKVHV